MVAAKYVPHTRANAPQRGSARGTSRIQYPPCPGSWPRCLHPDATRRARISTIRRSPGCSTWRASPTPSRRAFGAWGRGEAATTQRVRSQASGADGERDGGRRPAVQRRQGVRHQARACSRSSIVLFDMDGHLLCTLDGDALTGCARRRRAHSPCAHSPRPTPTVAAVVGAGRQGWTHVQMLAARDCRTRREIRIHDHRPDAAEAMAARAQRRGIPAVARRRPRRPRSTEPT